ncbi:hypothetical protein ACFY2Q_26065 [Micromonospora sp. NPDC000316]|uniref:hypothetical protein n=1 Tax=Micromonospora sp. NPDC000316 TaxID=3364216 RepID=UPI0036BEF73F
MAKKMLGKVVAGAALGGASLLVFAPGIAFADGHHDGGMDRDGKVLAKPHVVKAGEEVKLLEICPDRQEHAFVWSKVTGKVNLKPVKDDRGDDRGEWNKEDDSYGHEDQNKDEHGKDDKGKDDKGKDDKGKDDKGKDHEGKGEDGKDKPQPPADDAQPGGQGGGAADAYGDEGGKDSKDWKGEEHGQDAENGRDKDWGSKDEGKKDWESKDEGKKEWDSKGSEEYGSDKGWDSKGSEEYGSDEYGSDKGWDSKGSEEYGSDEYGSDKGWDSKGDDHGKDGWEREREFVYYGEATVDKDAKPGRYELKGSCGEGELVVLPHGGVDGGDGGASTGTDRGLATGGASLLGAAALGGIVLMRRRRTDGSLV